MNTFADHLNNDTLHPKLHTLCCDLNAACVKHALSPRDAGVVDPQCFVTKPLQITNVDLDDNETGSITVDSFWGLVTVEFDADDDVDGWFQCDLMEALHN